MACVVLPMRDRAIVSTPELEALVAKLPHVDHHYPSYGGGQTLRYVALRAEQVGAFLAGTTNLRVVNAEKIVTGEHRVTYADADKLGYQVAAAEALAKLGGSPKVAVEVLRKLVSPFTAEVGWKMSNFALETLAAFGSGAAPAREDVARLIDAVKQARDLVDGAAPVLA